MSSFKLIYKKYHQNAFLLGLFGSDLPEHMLPLLLDKHRVDLVLERHDQINLNQKLFLAKNFNGKVTRPAVIDYSNTTKNTISDINWHRLDMVWSRAMLETVFFYAHYSHPGVQQMFKVVALFNGLTSYGFYVLRGGIDLGMGIKGFYNISDEKLLQDKQEFMEMDEGHLEDDEKLTNSDIAYFQAQQRYQRIANDLLLWAPVNFLTFHVLVGPYEFAGNLITSILLLGDLSLSLFGLYDKYCKLQQILIDEELRLTQLNLAREDIDAHLEDIKKRFNESVQIDMYFISYQVLLIASFIVLWSPFSSNPVVSLVGAIACFSLQILVNQVQSFLKLMSCEEDYQAYQEMIHMFGRLLLQLFIPALFLISGMYILPVMTSVSAYYLFFACLVIDYFASIMIDDVVQCLQLHLNPEPVAQEHQAAQSKLLQDGAQTLAVTSSLIGSMMINVIPSLAISLMIAGLGYLVVEQLPFKTLQA